MTITQGSHNAYEVASPPQTIIALPTSTTCEISFRLVVTTRLPTLSGEQSVWPIR